MVFFMVKEKRLPVISRQMFRQAHRSFTSDAFNPNKGNPIEFDKQSTQLQLVRVDSWIPEKLMIRFTFRDTLAQGREPVKSTASILFNRPVGDVMQIIPGDVEVERVFDKELGLDSYVPVSKEIIGAVEAINGVSSNKYVFFGYLMMMGEDFTGKEKDLEGLIEDSIKEQVPLLTGIDSNTLSQIFGEISDVSESIPGVADDRINSLCPGIADTRIGALAPSIANTVVSNRLSESVLFNYSGTALKATVSDLDGSSQKVYKLQGRYYVTAATGTPQLYLQLNGDSDNNYDSERLSVSEGVVTAFSNDNTAAIALSAGGVATNPVVILFDITVLNNNGGMQGVQAHVTIRDCTTGSVRMCITTGVRKVSEHINKIQIGVAGSVTECNWDFKVTTPPIP